MTLPPDLPDSGPSIPDRFRAYPVERPTEGQVFFRLVLILAAVSVLLAGLAGWALS
jgi:hypothetical protein